MIDARIAGKGTRFFCKTRWLAEGKAALLRRDREKQATEAYVNSWEFRYEAASCAEVLAMWNATLSEATSEFIYARERGKRRPTTQLPWHWLVKKSR